jgi:uncharacterized membrane protein YeaQ/YmgE (transglycosylase-associated protein family)
MPIVVKEDPQVEIIGLIIFGAIIGALGRLVVPGRQPIPIWLTVVLGVIGALAGYYIAGALGVAETRGIDWIRWIISIAVAAVLVVVAANVMSSRRV